MNEHTGAEPRSDDPGTARAAGTCPDCGGSLQEGYLASGGGLSWSTTPVWIFWKGLLIHAWPFKRSEKAVTKVAANNIPADRCRKCSLLVVRY